MILSRQSATRIFSGAYLLLAAAALAKAQCYQFSGSGATLQINITGFNLSNPPITVAGGGRAASYLFTSSNTLTIGLTTQTSTSFLDGGISIQFLPAIGKDPSITEFQIVVPDATQVVTPRSGSHSWQAQLFGAGDLLPNGIVTVLPGIASWFVPPPSQLSNYIEVDSGAARIKYPITSIGSCSPPAGSASTVR